MTDIRPKDLPAVTSTTVGDKITLDGATTRSITAANLLTTGGLTAAFTNTTPVPVSTGGALTSASSSIDRLSLGGSAYLIIVTVIITTVGTGTGNITVALPVTPTKLGALTGQCINNGKTIAGSYTAGSATMTITNYDASSPIAAATYTLMGIVKV